MIDAIDELILSVISKNSRHTTTEIQQILKEYGYELTVKEIESKISTLEKNGTISGYTISVNLKKINRRTIRVILSTFRTSQHLPSRMEGLKKYLQDSPFVIFSGRTRGGYDWICIQAFVSEEIADEQSDIYRNLFGDIIQSYEVYDLNPIREPSLHALVHTDREYKDFVDEWIPAFLSS